MSEPLLAVRSGVKDLIYLSQGLRDHPTGPLYRIIPGSLVCLLCVPQREGGSSVVKCNFTPVKHCLVWSSMKDGAQKEIHLNAFCVMAYLAI